MTPAQRQYNVFSLQLFCDRTAVRHLTMSAKALCFHRLSVLCVHSFVRSLIRPDRSGYHDIS